MATFEPSSHHNANWQSHHTNPHAQQYQLANRHELVRHGRSRRSRSPDAAGKPSHGDASLPSGFRPTVKTVNTDLTRYDNSSAFRGTTPPQRLRYIFKPSEDVPEDYHVSDGRYRTWEEVPFDSAHKPRAWRDVNGVEWLPVLSRDASDRDLDDWLRREQRRAYLAERRERRYMREHDGAHSEAWERIRRTIYPAFLKDRNLDGSSRLLTPSGNMPMTLLDKSKPWHDREYHHVGRDPLANYQTIFGGLEAERERQRILTAEEQAAEELFLKHQRKEARDRAKEKRKEEKMMLKYDLELQKLEAKKQAQTDAEGHTKVVKKVIRRPNGKDEVIFVKRRVVGRSSSPPVSRPIVHAPWGSSIAAHRNAARQSTLERHGSNTNGAHERAHSATRMAWLSQGAQPRVAASQSRSPRRHQRASSRSSSRSRSRSTSSSRRRSERRAAKEEKQRRRDEERRKREHAKTNSYAIQVGPGELAPEQRHPRANEIEAYQLKESKERRAMNLDRLNATLSSLDKLSIGGVGSPVGVNARSSRDSRRRSRSSSSASSVSSRSGSSSSSSGFSSRSSSSSGSRRHRHRRRDARSRSRSASPRPKKERTRRHRARSHSNSSRSRSNSRLRSRSSSSSSSSSRSRSRSPSHRHSSSSTRPRDWKRRASFEEMDARVRANSDKKWLRAWSKRYSKATSERQKRTLKEEKKEWEARRKTQHTLLAKASQNESNDAYLQPQSTNSSNGVLTDQYGTPIASYGTVYPKPQGNLLQQASTLETYTASLAYSDKLLEETRTAMERSIAGMENIVDGLRVGYATKGLNAQDASVSQHALQMSLRAAIRAREDRRKKTEAMTRANKNVLDELRRQEAVIMDRAKSIEENSAIEEYEKQQALQRHALEQAQLQQHLLMLQQQAALDAANDKGRKPSINGHRPKSAMNLALGGKISGVDPYWYESAEPTFTHNMIAYNQKLRANLAATGQF